MKDLADLLAVGLHHLGITTRRYREWSRRAEEAEREKAVREARLEEMKKLLEQAEFWQEKLREKHVEASMGYAIMSSMAASSGGHPKAMAAVRAWRDEKDEEIRVLDHRFRTEFLEPAEQMGITLP